MNSKYGIIFAVVHTPYRKLGILKEICYYYIISGKNHDILFMRVEKNSEFL